MSTSEVRPRERDPYFKTNERKQAVDALEVTASFLEQVEQRPDLWSWTIIAVHADTQAFMVIALQGTWNVTTLHRDERTKKLLAQRDLVKAMEAGDDAAASAAEAIMTAPSDQLAAFEHLYERIKDPEGIMLRYMHSREYVPRETDDRCIGDLNEMRNLFLHYVPATRGILLTRFAAQTETGLRVIDFLLNESNAIDWFTDLGVGEDDLEPRARVALARACAALEHIQIVYADLARPGAPRCGSVVENN